MGCLMVEHFALRARSRVGAR